MNYSTDEPQQQSKQSLSTIEASKIMRPTSALTSPEWHNLQSRKSDAEESGQRQSMSAPLENPLAHSQRVKDKILRHATRRADCNDNTRGGPLSEVQTTTLASLPRHSKRRNTDDETQTQAVAMQKAEEVAEGVESSSSSGDAAATRDKGAISSSRDSSGGNGSASSRNVVTAATTPSSGDDRDSSGGNGSTNSGAATVEHIGSGSEMLRHNHHHHRVRRRSHIANDGSALRVPGDDAGSDRHAGGVSATSATVMASRLYPDATAFSSGSGGEGEVQQSGSRLQQHREPGYHTTTRRTFISLPRRTSRRRVRQLNGSIDSSSNEGLKNFKTKHGLSSPMSSDSTRSKKSKDALHARGRGSPSLDSVHSNAGGGGSSSGSGTEGGYAGSASSNEMAGRQDSCSSPSVCSSEESRPSQSKRHRNLEYIKRKTSKKSGRNGGSASSSEIADFSSSLSDSGVVDGGLTASPSASPSLSSSSNGDVSAGDLEASFLRAKQEAMLNDALIQAVTRKRSVLAETPAWTHNRMPAPQSRAATVGNCTISGALFNGDSKPSATLNGKAAILALGSDTMAHVLTFLEPPVILDVLTMPLSKDWRQSFTFTPELWRVLCIVEPFNAKIKDEGLSGSEESFCSLNQDQSKGDKKLLGCYRLLYTSFVRCMKYLSQIKDDAINGRPPSLIDYGLGFNNVPDDGTVDTRAPSVIGTSKSLHSFLSRARGVIVDSKPHGGSVESCENTSENSVQLSGSDPASATNGSSYGSSSTGRKVNPGDTYICVFLSIALRAPSSNSIAFFSSQRKRSEKRKKGGKRLKLRSSLLAQRLLGPSPAGQAGTNMNLPWSCTIYSIVNWMVAFSDVEGIQTLCLKVLPFLLEDEQQRITAQRAGLTDVVLRGMVMFPSSVQLHTAAFHTIVLLARPFGGREGMLFHSSMVNASGIFGSDSSNSGKNGIAVMIDSMRRFQDNDGLQAMSCWSLVNIALAPAQKAVLVKLGGIQVIANAMLRHQHSAEVQFRALFALINLVIPCKYNYIDGFAATVL